MKVLLVNHFPLQGSGSGIYTLNIASELKKEGHEVFVIDIDNCPDTHEYPFERYTIKCKSKDFTDYDLGFDFPCFTTHPRSNNTYYTLTSAQIKEYIDVYIDIVSKIVSQIKPDIIHAQHLWVAPYAAYKSGIPYIITAHGTDLMGFVKDKRYHEYALAGANNASRIITISRQVHNDVLRLYDLPESSLMLNPNGFDTDIFKVKEIDKEYFFNLCAIHKNYEKVVSFVGKLTDFKGVDILIEAAKLVTKYLPETAFILAGDGQLRQQLESQSAGFGNIYFLGHQTQKRVADLYNIADVSVVPSRIEPFGLVAIEAMACGTPVVATDAGGLPDFVSSKYGQLVPMEDPHRLADAISKELKDNTKQTKGKAAAEYAVSNYSWEKTLKNVVKLYMEALA